MSKHQSKQQAYLEAMGFAHAEVERLAADRTAQGVATVQRCMIADSNLRRIVTEIRQADREQYERIRIVPI